METNPNNPYQLDYGFEDTHDQVISGYGITLDSIRYWLFEHNFDCSMVNVLQYLNQKQVEPEYDDSDIDSFVIEDFLNQRLPNNEIQYVTGNNLEFEALMVYDTPINDEIQTIANRKQINQQLIQVIKAIFNLNDKPQIKEDLTKFINKYTDYISVCDYS